PDGFPLFVVVEVGNDLDPVTLPSTQKTGIEDGHPRRVLRRCKAAEAFDGATFGEQRESFSLNFDRRCHIKHGATISLGKNTQLHRQLLLARLSDMDHNSSDSADWAVATAFAPDAEPSSTRSADLSRIALSPTPNKTRRKSDRCAPSNCACTATPAMAKS